MPVLHPHPLYLPSMRPAWLWAQESLNPPELAQLAAQYQERKVQLPAECASQSVSFAGRESASPPHQIDLERGIRSYFRKKADPDAATPKAETTSPMCQ